MAHGVGVLAGEPPEPGPRGSHRLGAEEAFTAPDALLDPGVVVGQHTTTPLTAEPVAPGVAGSKPAQQPDQIVGQIRRLLT